MKHLVGLLLLAGYSACVPCDTVITEHALAPRPQYDTMVDTCVTRHSCAALCREVFVLDPSIVIEHCGVTAIEPAFAHVTVRYYDANACSGDDSIDISSYDDGSYDDGSSDDGSTDDGSSDDGSSDDGSSGSDDGSSGSDDGSDSGDGGDSGGDSGDSGDPRLQNSSHAALTTTTSTTQR